jgi:hypothetical protein
MQNKEKINKVSRLYYFTKFKHAYSAVKDKRLKVSRLNDLNDLFDFRNVMLSNDEAKAHFQKILDELEQKQGLICFSQRYWNPTMWGHYADHGTGVGLGFDVSVQNQFVVDYENRFLDLQPYKDNMKKFAEKIASTKAEDWKYEKEVRIFIELSKCTYHGHSTNGEDLCFAPFSKKMQVREILLGPKCKADKSNIDTIKSYINSAEVQIFRTKPASDRFEILKEQEL